VAMEKEMLRDWILMGLDELSECSDSLESSLKTEKEKVSARFDKMLSSLTAEEQEDVADWYGEEYSKIAEVIPNIVRSSLFVSYYSFLERRLLAICWHLKHDLDYKLDASDLRDTGIFRARTYLKKVAGIKFPDDTHSWNEIVFYNRIRNLIVHEEGRIPKGSSAKAIKSFIKRKKWLKVDNMNRVCFPKDFSVEVTRNLKDFIEKVIDALP
jgi:hypothetical protein